jgi:hypothetical protein
VRDGLPLATLGVKPKLRHDSSNERVGAQGGYEAVRASPAGYGFGIVAAEVKKLAADIQTAPGDAW